MNFFKTFAETLHSHSFYHSIHHKTLKTSFGYFAKIALMLGAFGAVVSAIFIAPIFTSIIEDIKTEVLSFYPETLEIKIEKGVATTNAKSEPLFFPFKPSWKKVILSSGGEHTEKNDGIQNVFVLNTKTEVPATPETFKNMDTFALLTHNFFVHYDKNYAVVFEDLSKTPDVIVNHETFVELFALAHFIPFALPFLYFFVIFVSTFTFLFYLLISSLLFFFIQKFLKKDFSFKESYKICIYASSAPAVLSLLFFFSGMPIPIIQHLFVLLTALIAVINTKPHKQI